jgi:hypothetical protein
MMRFIRFVEDMDPALPQIPTPPDQLSMEDVKIVMLSMKWLSNDGELPPAKPERVREAFGQLVSPNLQLFSVEVLTN